MRSISKDDDPPDLMDHIRNGARTFMRNFYLRLGQLEKLIVQHPWTLPPFVHPSNDRLVPMHFFTSSLKYLYMSRWTEDRADETLSARNCLWLLLFCPQVQELSLGFAFSVRDADFLNEHREAFASKSNVKYLALDFHVNFHKSKKRTWWGQPGESEKNWRGGSRKTQALMDFLSVVKNLRSLELYNGGCEKNKGDLDNFFSSCLLGLQGSAKSLQKLRMVGLAADEDYLFATAYGIFEHLKVLSLEKMPLFYLSRHQEISLPSSLEVLVIPHTSFQTWNPEYSFDFVETDLMKVLETRSLPNLRLVVMPAEALDEWGDVVEDVDFRKGWLERRKELEGQRIFQSGKVELRKLTLEEMSEYDESSLWLDELGN